jgi:peptidoglycan hydrolase CwlO-like protein
MFKRKSDKVVDWRYKRAPASRASTQKSSSDTTVGDIGYLGEMVGAARDDSESEYDSSEEKKKKLAKRIYELTDRIEDLSNQIYHLQQRIELLEKKMGRNFE